MFLEDMLLENDDDILEGEGFMESEDDELDLFSEALSLGGVKSGVNKGLEKVGLKKKEQPKPLTKKEKVIKAVKNVDKKKVVKIVAVIGGALTMGGLVIAAAKKIKASKAAKEGQIDTKAVDEKVSVVKRAMNALKSLRAKFTKAVQNLKAKKALKRDNFKGKELKGLLSKNGGEYDSYTDAYTDLSGKDITEVNKHVSIIKKVYAWIVKVGKAAGCKVSGAKDAVKQKFMKESALMENADYREAFECVMDASIEEFNTYMENVELDSYLADYVAESVMEALEAGAYDDDDDDYDFDF